MDGDGEGGVITPEEPKEPEVKPEDLYTYKEVEGGYAVTGFNLEFIDEHLEGVQPTDIVLPTEYKGEKVIQVFSMAFNSKGITSVEFSDSISKLGSKSFANNNIKKLKMPKTIKETEGSSFTNSNIEK